MFLLGVLGLWAMIALAALLAFVIVVGAARLAWLRFGDAGIAVFVLLLVAFGVGVGVGHHFGLRDPRRDSYPKRMTRQAKKALRIAQDEALRWNREVGRQSEMMGAAEAALEERAVASDSPVTKILLIDDEAPIRLLCRVNLENAGMQVIEAHDGFIGLRKAREESPDLILLDVMMPGIDGWQVAERLLEDPATCDIPIVFLTPRTSVDDRRRGLEIGAVDYLTVPFNPVELAPMAEALLERLRRGEREELRREKLADLKALGEE